MSAPVEVHPSADWERGSNNCFVRSLGCSDSEPQTTYKPRHSAAGEGESMPAGVGPMREHNLLVAGELRMQRRGGSWAGWRRTREGAAHHARAEGTGRNRVDCDLLKENEANPKMGRNREHGVAGRELGLQLLCGTGDRTERALGGNGVDWRSEQ